MLDRLLWVDLVILGVIALSMLMSLWRGFIREALSLVVWVAAFVVGYVFAERAAGLLVEHVSVPSVRLMLGFGGLFLATLFVGGLVNIVVAQMVLRTGLGPTDRLFGLIFGVLRGVLVVAVLVLLAGLTPVPEDPWWNASMFLPHFQQLALWLRDFLPPAMAEHFSFP